MMLIKNLNILTSLLLLSLFSTISTNAVKANTLETKELPSSSEFSAEPENYLLSQSLGHQEYLGEPQMSWNDYQTGTIVGKNGSSISVITEDGTLIHGEWEIGSVGDTVLIVDEDGITEVIDSAYPAWVGTLEQDYEFSIDNDARLDPPLQERTAPLWRQLGY